MGERTAIQEPFPEFLGTGLIFADEDRLEIAEVLGTGLVAFLCGSLRIEIPEFDGGFEPSRERNVGKSLPGAPCDRVRADQTRNPYGRMRFLQRQYPRVHEAKVEVLALEAKRPRRGPRLYDEIDALLEILTVVGRIRIVGELLAARAPNPARHQAPAGDQIDH